MLNDSYRDIDTMSYSRSLFTPDIINPNIFMMRKISLISLMTTVMVLMLPACSDSNEPGVDSEEPLKPRVDIPLTRSQQELVDSEVRFSFDFLSAVNNEFIQGNDNSNYAVSPLSMQRDLSILANGAAGTTLEEIMNVLHLGSEATIDDLNNLNATLLNGLLNADSWVKLLFSSSAWFDTAFPVKDDYTNLIGNNYDTPFTYVDFRDKAAKNIINSWVKEHTKGEIERLIGEDESTDNVRFMLLDALYFKGKWADVFEKDKTTSGTFYNHGVEPVSVSTMNTTAYVGIDRDEQMTTMSMDFGNRSFSMNFMMANEGYDIDDLISAMDYERWQAIKNGMGKRELQVYLPKFKVSKEIALTSVLEKLGLSVISPDLSLLSDNDVDLLRMRQNTVIEVEERGALATTVTEIAGMDTAAGPISEEIHFDRPFIFFIEEQSTGAILFMGKITEL